MTALGAVAGRLRCPNCAAPLALEDPTLACANGHRFDVARQGYVSLLPPQGTAITGDSAEMVAAREAFHAKGHFAPIAEALPRSDGLVVELGAGTAYYLAHVADRYGIALDVSKPALRRIKHERIAAIACDVWQGIPLQDATADLVLVVFAPRNGAEIARVLAPDGELVVVTPTEEHLEELREPLGLIAVDPDKDLRLHASLKPLKHRHHRRVEFSLTLAHTEVEALVTMGPNAHHVEQLDERIAQLPDPVTATASVVVDTFATSP